MADEERYTSESDGTPPQRRDKGGRDQVKFETICAEKKVFGRNNFIEVARKRAHTPDGSENVFLSISRGYFMPDKTERFRTSVSIPLRIDGAETDEVREWVAEKIRSL